MPVETTSDKIIDQMLKISKEMTSGNQVQGLWRCFNIMVSFIKGQANLVKEMDAKIKQLDRRVLELEQLNTKPKGAVQ